MNQKEIDIIKENLKMEQSIDQETLESLTCVIKIMKRLRAPEGCPWDKVQTHQSLLKNLLEEAYEYIETVERNDHNEMREELGDLFMQIVFHAQVAEENGTFNLKKVGDSLVNKLIARHPHVFGNATAVDETQALNSWNNAKRKEGVDKHDPAKVPLSMPALLRSRKIQEKAGRVGFEWPTLKGAISKVDEELAEFKEAIESGNKDHICEELGDLLLVIVNVGRNFNQCSEVALTKSNEKFLRRFKHIENSLAKEGRTPAEATLEEMDEYWNEAKEIERRNSDRE